MKTQKGYLVLVGLSWDALRLEPYNINLPKKVEDGPEYFCPIFLSKKRAMEFANDDSKILEIELFLNNNKRE